ncbi:MAG: hypothetical protein MUC58_13085 [Rhizobiaceae bacterium]|jgi:hypothetical protein|nr:hypothetical protein [Rhizobiaceae bacterium]
MTAHDAASRRHARLTTATLLVAEPLLFFAAFGVLGAAINWPASLGLPWSEALPLIAANLTEVRFGYGLYLASSLLTAPLAVALLASWPQRSLWLDMAALAMVLAAVFKALGITRWLIAMPALVPLADAGDPGIAAAFTALNEYAGGGLGEWMGVGLMTGLWMLCLAFALARTQRLAAILFAAAALPALLIVPNEFGQWLPTAALQGTARFASLAAQLLLAWHLLRQPQ